MAEQFYRIFETDEFIKRISKFSKRDASFIRNKLIAYVYPQLKSVPRFGNNIKKLTGYNPETWRYRIGKYRLFFSINDQAIIVNILTIEFRKDAY